MMMHPLNPWPSRLLGGSLLLALACASTPGAGPASEAQVLTEPPPSLAGPFEPPAGAWTTRFEGDAVLLGDRVHVEGPVGLLEHLASAQDPAGVDYSVEFTPQGLRQVSRVQPGAGQGRIDAQLDRWRIVAFEELVVCERPGDIPVRVTSRGGAVFHDASSAERLQGESLSFVGQRRR